VSKSKMKGSLLSWLLMQPPLPCTCYPTYNLPKQIDQAEKISSHDLFVLYLQY